MQRVLLRSAGRERQQENVRGAGQKRLLLVQSLPVALKQQQHEEEDEDEDEEEQEERDERNKKQSMLSTCRLLRGGSNQP